MTSSTDPRPDPEAWARDLRHDLEVLGEKYLEARRSPDGVSGLGESQQLLMSALVMRLGEAFNEVPAFEGNPGLAMLHDLHDGLLGLQVGLKHPLFVPSSVAKGAPDSFGRQLVKKIAILCVRVLVDSGSSEVDARRYVARVLSSTGHVGRKGGSINEKLIWEWETAADATAKAYVARHFDRVILEVDHDPTHARMWVDRMLRQPGLMTKI